MSLSPYKEYAITQQTPQPLAVQGAADPTYFLPKLEAGRFWTTLLRRGWMVVLLSLLGSIVLYALASRMPATYRATGSVFVGTQAPQILDIKSVAPEETKDLEQMRSVEQGLAASTLLMRLIEKNGLANDPTFAPPGLRPQALVQFVASRVHVELRRGTRIIDISVDDTDPARARKLVESLVKEYEAWAMDRQQQITNQASEGLSREEQRLRTRMDEWAKKLQDFRETHPIPGLEGSDSGSPVRDELSTLSAQLTAAKGERLRLESEYETFVKFDASDPQSLAGLETSERGTEVLSQVRGIQQKEADFARIKERYMYKHPVFIEAANEIALMKSKLAETTRAAGEALQQRYKIALDNENKLSAEVALARTNAVENEGAREKFRSFQREAEADRVLHDSVAQRLRETTLASSVPSSVLRWEDTPMEPEAPRGPRKVVFAAVGLFGGFLAGTFLLIALELSDGKVRDTAAAARATGTPLLASIPTAEKVGDAMVLLSNPSSETAEAFRHLRTVLAPSPGHDSGRTVLFSSARAGEGKSFCALNYATSLAMQGHRTLLIDADLRAPGLSADYTGHTSQDAGLGGYLAGRIDPAQACHSTPLPNLYLIASGPIRMDAAELLAGTRFPSLLEDAFRWFDRVVIDSPSVLSTGDMLSIARYADRCCLIVKDEGSHRRDLKRAADLIRSAGGNLIGFVWNESGHSFSNSSGNSASVRVNSASLPVGNQPALTPAKRSTLRAAPPRFA